MFSFSDDFGSEISGVTFEEIDDELRSIFYSDDFGLFDIDSSFFEDPVSEEQLDNVEIKYEWGRLTARWSPHGTPLNHQIMWRCLYFCYLFPKTYEFYKDDMIQLWIASLFNLFGDDISQNDISLYFDEFELMHIFLQSHLDASTGRLRYRLNHSIVDQLQQRHHDDEDVIIRDANSHISENTLRCSLPYSSMHSTTLKNIYLAKRLSTLLIIHEPGYIHQVPRELFLNLPFLRVLDFSYTNITELPNSIGKLKDLRYLNLSGTPITTLPNSLCNLYQMQTLKLRRCLKLAGLPGAIRKLINLRHLDLDLACLLVSMPPGFGDLTELQSLPAFIVGKENGCHITELKHMLNLGGTLRILRLENVSSSEEAKEAYLDNKIHLQKLELQWTGLQDGIEVLENLKPNTEIRELQIVGYGGVRFPIWVGDPLFSKLVTITIHDSKHCELLPPLGKLPFLCDLCISEMHEVKVIDHQFCGRNMDTYFLDLGKLELGKVADNLSNANMFNAFPRLEKLTLNGLPNLERWTGIEEGDFPLLQKLNLSSCSKLTALAELPVLKSLQELVISSCPSLESFPNEGLPASLQYLVILDCLLLKERCQRDWRMLQNIPNIWINYQQVSPVSSSFSHTQNSQMSISHSHILALQNQGNIGHQAGFSEQITRKSIEGGTTTQRVFGYKKSSASDEDPLVFDVIHSGKHACNKGSSITSSQALGKEGQKQNQIQVLEEREQKRSEDFQEMLFPMPEQIIMTSKDRKTVPRWTEKVRVTSGTVVPRWTEKVRVTSGTVLDGHNWRKFGQKDILGAKYPRSYYRCIDRHVQGCLATKQVQPSDEDPLVFDITYRRKHTCNRASSTTTISGITSNQASSTTTISGITSNQASSTTSISGITSNQASGTTSISGITSNTASSTTSLFHASPSTP